MRPIQSYFLLILMVWGFSANAQKTASAIPLPFPDSVRIVLENTKNVEATVIATAFSSAWNSLGVDHQLMIQKQVRLMKQKKIALRPSIVNYLGAISNAVTIENADASKLTGFLNVAQKAIENENGARLAQFFKSSRTFFQFHALYYDRKYRLYARDDNYSFDYVEPAAGFDLSAPSSDPATEPEPEAVSEPPAEEPAPGEEESPPQDFYAEAPLYMNPPPPPMIEGPVIKFDKVTLNFVTHYDSVFLRDARGTFSLRDYTFVGEQGKFDFTAAGIPADVVDCDISVFTLKANLPEFKSDLTKLNYKEKTPGYIPGILEFKSVPRKDSVASTYPRFKSFQSSLEVKAVDDPNVKYTGGFSLTGNKISGASLGGENSRIEVSANSEKKFVALSREFLFTESTVISNKARVAMYFGADSITHPAVRFRYAFEGDSTQKLSIRKDKGGMKHTPYFSSFFNVDFAADVIRWNLRADSLTIEIDGGRNTVPMVIESVDYYDREDYRLLKGEGFSFHPVALVATYCIQNKVREFYTGDLVVASGKEGRDVKAAIEFLAEKGLVDYNVKTDKVIVKEKAIVLYRGARGEVDYDNLKILSVTDSFPNATVNYAKGQMTVRGVDEFKVSDSLNVRIQPDSSTITLLRDRDIKFDGTINAGNFEISGKGFTLKYDSFYIRLTHIDSINFFVTETNARGQSIRRKINNSMVNADAEAADSLSASLGGLGTPGKSSGILYISKGNNKSGMKKAGSFPRLDASSGGKIYFDRHEVLDGAYDKSVFFIVPPFKLDSLSDADPASINFEGSFSSSGMFPVFKEKLHTQPDKSLGFTHNVPATGYKLYQGDGKYNGALSLDNRGIRGNGSIQFLAATVNSPDFTFFPDSVTARGEIATIEQKQFGSVLFPQAKLTNFDMKWLPKEDKMMLKNTNAPFEFYNSTAQMRGTITVSKEGVAGAGRFESRGTELVSKNMKFSGTDFSARRARFKVKSEDPNKPLLTGTDVRMVFNLEKNYADISPEVSGVAAIDFPYAQFKTSIPNMRWDVNAQKITMSKEPGQPLEESYFYTTREDLDSLNFNADRAVYDLTTQTLKVSGIPYIIVADAKITPENNEVTILENAKIGTLTNTTIVLDTLNAYHRLTQGVVDIKSRKEFSGYATYQYVNFLQDTFAIKMTDFHLEPISEVEVSRKAARKNAGNATMQTVGVGNLLEKDAVVLGAGMFYKGDLTMYATRPALELKGFVKLDIEKIKDYNTWIHYEQTGDETEVMLDYDKAITEEGDKVNAGLHFNSTDNNLYITFMSKKHSEDDDDLFVPGGKLYYDTATHEFKIEDLEKAKGTKLSGKVFAYNDDNMQVRFEGPIKLVRGGKGFDIAASALGQGSIETNEIRMNSFLLLDTEIPTPALDEIAAQLQEVIKNEGADEGLGDPTELLYKIADIAGEKATRDYEQRSQQGYVSLSTISQLIKSIALANVQLKWSQKHKAFYNEGKIGVSHILKHDINGAFEGFLEVRKTEDGGTVFHLFFKASPEAWYYFGFEDNRLMVQSSNGSVNGIISKKTNAKAKPGEVVFIPGSDEETLAFINRFRKDYYAIDYGYDLGEAAAPPSESTTPAVPAVVPAEQKPTQVDPNEPQDQVLPKEEEVKEEETKKQKKQKKSKEKTPAEEPDQKADEPKKEEPKKEEPKKEEDDGF